MEARKSLHIYRASFFLSTMSEDYNNTCIWSFAAMCTMCFVSQGRRAPRAVKPMQAIVTRGLSMARSWKPKHQACHVCPVLVEAPEDLRHLATFSPPRSGRFANAQLRSSRLGRKTRSGELPRLVTIYPMTTTLHHLGKPTPAETWTLLTPCQRPHRATQLCNSTVSRHPNLTRLVGELYKSIWCLLRIQGSHLRQKSAGK